jgi:ankyrin repeat protein
MMNQELINAFKNKDIEAVKSFIASGIDINYRAPGTATYLDYAWCGFGEYDFEIVKLLIDNGAELNESSHPAIVCASGRGNIDEIQYILDRGANINATSHVGTSALWHAAYKGNIELVKFLLRNGLDIHKHGGRALQVATSSGNRDIVQLLVEEKVDINYQVFDKHADKSNTPLHYAALFGHLEITHFLLKNGANPALKNHYGYRPYSLAKKQKYKEIMDLIASYEPKELHDLDNKIAEVKRAGLPTAIIKSLGEERKRVELPSSKYVNYIEFCSIMDVSEMEFEGNRMLNLLFDVDAYDSLGFLVWIPSKKALGSYDVEHQKLIILHDADWKKFNKSPSLFIDRILDGEYEIDEE